MTRRHRPAHLLWVAGQYRSACSCHFWQPVRYDRPLPACPPTITERAA